MPDGGSGLFGLLQAQTGGDEHNDDQQQIPAEEAVAHGHPEDPLGQGQQSVAQLGHKGIGDARQRHGDPGIFPPLFPGEDGVPAGQGNRGLPEEGKGQQQFHQREHGANGQQHGCKHQHFLGHKYMVGVRKGGIQTQSGAEPAQGHGHTGAVVGGEPVVGFQQLHPPGGAVFKTAVGGVPGGLFHTAAQELGTEGRVEHTVVHEVPVIPEIAELLILRLQQKHIVEVDLLRIIDGIVEQLTALQNRGFGGDVHTVFVGGTGIGGSHTPAGPGAHGVTAEGQTAGIHAVQTSQQGIGGDAAAGTVGDGIAVAVGRVVGIKEAEIGEIHHQPEPLGTAHGYVGAVGFAVLTKVDFYTVVYITTLHETGFTAAMAVFIQRKHHCPPAGQLNGVGGAGFVVVLVAVEQQHTGCGGIRGGGGGNIELVGEVPHIRFQYTPGDGHISIVRLDPVGGAHAQEQGKHQHQQQCQMADLSGFHKINSLLLTYNVSIAQSFCGINISVRKMAGREPGKQS